MKIQDALDLHLKEEASRIIGDVVDHARGYVRFFLDDYSSGRDVGGQGQRYRVVGRR